MCPQHSASPDAGGRAPGSACLCPFLQCLVELTETGLGTGKRLAGEGNQKAAEGLALRQPGAAVGFGEHEAVLTIADLARQARDVARRHPWLGQLLHRPVPPGPGGLRYLDYFLGLLAGSVLDTGAKLEVIAIITGFATMYGAIQAAPAGKGNETPSAEEQTSAQIQSFVRAAASGDYPNLAAALATAGPQRTQDDVFESSIQRLIDGARLPDKPLTRTT